MKKFQVEKEYDGYTLKEYLKSVHSFSTRGMKSMEAYVNNKIARLDKKLKHKDIIRVKEAEKESRIKPIFVPLDIIYEDKEFLVINKQPFLITHPTLKKESVSLANGIAYYYLEKGINMVLRFYNRLDMNTSGVIIIAKSAYAQAYLQSRGELKKVYLAVVDGIVEKDEFLIESKIGVSADGIKREIRDDGQEAKTFAKVIKRDEKLNKTLLEVELFTGRTHQIRVHLSSLGHPITGDELYGGDTVVFKRQLLHSWKTEFENPETKERTVCVANLPEDFPITQ